MDDPRDLQKRLFELFEPTAERMGCELVAVEITTSGGRRALRVSVDGPSGVEVGVLARLSRALSVVLDVEDPIMGAYVLEVSSPGIDRPVQRRADYQRFAGYRVRIRLEPGIERRRYTGVLLGLDGDHVRLDVDGQEHRVPLDQIVRTRLVLDLDEYQALAANPSPSPDTHGGLS